MNQDYYRLLNIPPNASPKDVKQAAQSQLNQLKKIYAVLSDPEKRAAYDERLASEQSVAQDNYYELLNLPRTASVDTIKATAQRRVQEIKQAFSVLSDAAKRSAYDAHTQAPNDTPPDSDSSQPLPLKTKPQAPPSLDSQTGEATTATPQASSDGTPATRFMRFKAAVLDVLILWGIPLFIVSLLASFIFGLRGPLIVVPILTYGVGAALREMQAVTGSNLSLLILISIFVVVVGALLLINLLWLYRYGQTIGKRLVGIKIVNADGSRYDFMRILIMRVGLIWLITLALFMVFGPIVLLIPLLDSLAILQSSQQCLHDMLARTRIVQEKNNLWVGIKAKFGKTQDARLASPLIRLGAAVLDVLVFFIPVLLVLIMVFFVIGFLNGFENIPSMRIAFIKDGRWAPGGPVFSAWMSGFMLFVLISFIAIIITHLVWLHRYGQSMGKRLLKIKVIRKNDKPCGLLCNVFTRSLPIYLLLALPFFFLEGLTAVFLSAFLGLIDVLFIFSRSRQCLHDRLPGTSVIYLEKPANP